MMGWLSIKKGRRETHKRFMLSAVFVSILFLTSYLIYHYNTGSTPYPRHDFTRVIYFSILIPHTILATLVVPLIITNVVFALKGKFARHKKLARWVFPIWMFVSVSGVVIYLMLYHFA
jgi:uncharacterized membrane protein YozB (DUF420 family)